MAKPKVSVIIVNYHTDTLVLNLVKTITSLEHEIIIVENGKESAEINKKTSSRIKYIVMGENAGFAKANNRGISEARGEWILLLNSDTKTTSKDIDNLVQETQKHTCLAAAPQLVYEDGKPQQNIALFEPFGSKPLDVLFARPRFINTESVSHIMRVDFATAAALLIHSSVFKTVGMLDENFFMYFEDLDFCHRLKQQGIQILYVPSVVITHFEGTSSDKNTSTKKQNYTHGLNLYIRKHRGPIIEWLNTIIPVFR